MRKVYINCKGRLANVMFQAATVVWYAKKNNCIPVLHMSNKNEYFDNFLFRYISKETGLEVCKMKIDKEPPCESTYYNEISYDAEYITGFRQSPKYFGNDRNFAKTIFSPFKELIEEIESLYGKDLKEYISVHVRRGDYVNKKVRFNVLSKEQIQSSLDKICKGRKVIFVSDDIEWCKENFGEKGYAFADKKSKKFKSYMLDLFLMTLCGDNIISNSSFSWWGAYLNINKDRKVYYRLPWLKGKSSIDIIPENDNWILL